MNEAKTTWALIVGIDEYDNPKEVPSLKGAVADALAAYHWLRRLGVPDGQILVNASPCAGLAPELEEIRPGFLPARAADIDDSLIRLEEVPEGTRLFLFLFGHGIFEPTSRRLFLTQEFKEKRPMNLALDLLIPRLLAMRFERQFLFMDGCQNLPYSPTERQRIKGDMYGGREGLFIPQPENGLVACYSAAQGQLALEVGGRGLFSRHLFEALDPDKPWRKGVDLDFATGVRTVDLAKVMDKCVRPRVEREAFGQPQPLRQTPQLQVEGASQSRSSHPVLRLEEVHTAAVEMKFQPPDAVGDLQQVMVFVTDPLWVFTEPVIEGDPVSLPERLHLPVGVKARAQYDLRSDSPWTPATDEKAFDVLADQTLIFAMRARSEEQVPAPSSLSVRGKTGDYATEPEAAEEVIRVTTFGPHGQSVSDAFKYKEIAESLNLQVEPESGVEITRGVQFVRREVGPEFKVSAGSLSSGFEEAARWAEAIQKATPAAVGVSVASSTAAGARPSLRIELPAGGAASLAGPLAGLDLVWIGRPNAEPAEPLWRQAPAGGRLESLAYLQQHPRLELSPGPLLVRLDLPWGSWTDDVVVPHRGEAVLKLPDRVGTPPLRVTLHAEVDRAEPVILGIGGERPQGRLLRGLGGGGDAKPLTQAVAGTAAWALQPSEPLRELGEAWRGCGLAELDTAPKVVFPVLGKRPMAVDLSGNSVRVEPLSGVILPEWDLLVASGRLDVLSAENAVDLVTGQNEDGLLKIAAAYAVHAAPQGFSHSFFNRVKGDLDEIARKGPLPDADLLHVALRYRDLFPQPGRARSRKGARWLAQEAHRLEPWAEKQSVPVLRWGVTIALQLLEGLGDSEPFAAWRDALARIEPRLSPISVWTAWTESADA